MGTFAPPPATAHPPLLQGAYEPICGGASRKRGGHAGAAAYSSHHCPTASRVKSSMPERSINSRPLLEHEFAQERASALGRQGRALEAALAALFELDGKEAGEPPAGRRALRAAPIERASVALWHLIVHREAC